MALDGPWIDFYLRRFTRYGVRQGHHEDDKVYTGGGLCSKSCAAAVTVALTKTLRRVRDLLGDGRTSRLTAHVTVGQGS